MAAQLGVRMRLTSKWRPGHHIKVSGKEEGCGAGVMLKIVLILLSAIAFALPAGAQTRVRADPSAMDPPIVRMPSGSSNPSPSVGSQAEPRYPGRLRDYANPRAEYGWSNQNLGVKRR